MERYNIAGITMEIHWEDEKGKRIHYHHHDCVILPRSLNAYHTDYIESNVDLIVNVGKLIPWEEIPQYKCIRNQIYMEMNNKIIIGFLSLEEEGVPGYSLEMNRDYSNVTLRTHLSQYLVYDLQSIHFAFVNRLLLKDGLVLHGAAIEYKEKGIIFSGISGAGKSTQAHLWKKYRNALIINGDCPAIRVEGNETYVYGTPWCGSSGESVDRCVPLTNIVIVQKSNQNKVTELTEKDACYAVLAFVLRTNFDSSLLNVAIGRVKEIVRKVRVLRLECCIEEEAVRVLEEEIF